MKIGNIEVGSVISAPLAGYSDIGMRTLAARYDSGLVYTEMVSAKGLCYRGSDSAELLKCGQEDRPIAVQLFGSEHEFFSRALQKRELDVFDIIDINFGCPVRKIVGNGEGSAMLLHPDKAYEIVRACVQSAGGRPVTAKMRIGFDSYDSGLAISFAKMLESAEVAAITVHGRTRSQGYSGQADYRAIEQVKASVSVPVVGNGDVTDVVSYTRMLNTGVDCAMIGRGAIGNPYIFANLTDVPHKSPYFDDIHTHIELLKTIQPIRRVLANMKKQLCYYAQHLPAKCRRDFKLRATSIADEEELNTLLDEYFSFSKQE